LEREFDREAKTELLPMQPVDVPDTCADIDDLMRDVGFSPSTPIEEGFHRFVSRYREFHRF
jgi:UDP-glucuronate 4-epimerase